MKKLRWFHYLSILVLLVFLFHLSPFSEVEYPIKCFVYPYERYNPVGAQLEPFCEIHIDGDSYKKPIFPFKEKVTKDIEFCRDNVKTVESFCGVEVDEVVINNYPNHYFRCEYVSTDAKLKTTWRSIIIIKKSSENYLNSMKQEGNSLFPIEIFEVHTDDFGLSNKIACRDLENNLEE